MRLRQRRLGAPVLSALAEARVRLIALRSAGFNHVDLAAAEAASTKVGRVPAYSPHAVAEHTVAMLLTLNRKTHRAFNRVREGNFALNGLLGSTCTERPWASSGRARSARSSPAS